MTRIALACSLAIAAISVPAAARDEQMISVYTPLDLETGCSMVEGATDEEAGGGQWWCEGYRGIAVRVAEGDLRFFVGYGRDAAEQCSSRQTLGAFNTIGTTLEWRLLREYPGHMTPVATILRYKTNVDGRTGEYLVVTRLDGAQACHMAYVDVRAQKDANALARVAADRFGPTFDCGRDRPFMMSSSGPVAGETPGTGGCE
jgi:hypothetical protein